MVKNTALVKSDTRPLLFRAIEYGRSIGFLDGALCAKIEADLIAMALRLAERHGTLSTGKGLADACYGTIGIANRGVVDDTDHGVMSAAVFVRTHGAIGCFRRGWKRIERAMTLLRRVNARIPLDVQIGLKGPWVEADGGIPAERALVHLVAYEWSQSQGDDALKALMCVYHKDIARVAIHEHIIRRYAGEFWEQAEQEGHAVLTREKTFCTLLITAGVWNVARPEIASVDMRPVLDALKEKDTIPKILRTIAGYFGPRLPLRYRKTFADALKEFCDNELQQLVRAARNDPFLVARDGASILLNLRTDIGEHDAQAYEQICKDLTKGGFSRKDIRALLTGDIPGMPTNDAALNLAVLDLFVKGKRLNAQELQTILVHIPSAEWRGKIAWTKIPWRVITSAWIVIAQSPVSMGMVMRDLTMSDVLADCLSGSVPAAWLRTMPIEWAYEAIMLFPKAQDRIMFLERVDISAEGVVRRMSVHLDIVHCDGGRVPNAYRYVSLVLPEKWFLIWRRKVADTPENAKVFLSFLTSRNLMPWESRADMTAYLQRIVRGIADPWCTDQKLRQESAPFFAPHLEEVVRGLLSVEEFAELCKKLQDIGHA